MKPLLPVLLLLSISSSAQIPLTLKAGSTFSFFRNYNNSIYGNNPFSQIEEKAKTGIVVGLATSLKINGNVSIQPEFLYGQKGYVVHDSYEPVVINGGSNQSYKMTWHFIDLPILLKAKVQNNLFLEFGPSVSYLLKAHYKRKVESFFHIPNNMTGFYSRFDAGLNTGIAYQYKKLEIEVRYYIGLIETNVKDVNSSDPEIIIDSGFLPYGKHRALQLTVGYKLK